MSYRTDAYRRVHQRRCRQPCRRSAGHVPCPCGATRGAAR